MIILTKNILILNFISLVILTLRMCKYTFLELKNTNVFCNEYNNSLK